MGDLIDGVARIAWCIAQLLRKPNVLEFGAYRRRWGCSRRTWTRDVDRLRRAGFRLESTWTGKTAGRDVAGEPTGYHMIAYDAEMAS